MSLFLLIPAGVAAYVLVGWLLSCLALRMDHLYYYRKNGEYTESDRGDLRSVMVTFWPLSSWVIFPCLTVQLRSIKQKKGALVVLNDYLSTPREVRKAKS